MKYTVQTTGKFVWDLVVDIDNTGGGEYSRTETLVTRTKLVKSKFVSEIVRQESSRDASFKSKVDAGGVIKLIKIDATTELGYSQHLSLFNELSSNQSQTFEVEKTETFEEKITVRSGEKFKLYQLRFETVGVSATFRTKATEPRNVEVTISTEVEVDDGILPPGWYAIKTAHNTFLRAAPGGEGSSANQQTSVGPWEKWYFQRIRGDTYGIRSAHGTYLRGHPGGEGARIDLQVDKHDWGQMPWEQFVVVPATIGKYALRSWHGTYIRAHPGGERAKIDLQVDKHDWEQMPWEQFALVKLPTTSL